MVLAIPTSLSARLHPFFSVMANTGKPFVDDVIDAGVPAAAFERRDVRYSLPLAYRFFEKFEAVSGMDDLAFRGAQLESFDEIETPFRARYANACTLMVCAHRYMADVRRYNGRKTALIYGRGKSRVLTQTASKVADESWNRFSDWSNLLVALAIFREALGRSWTPDEITLQTHAPIGYAVRSAFPNTVVKTGCLATSFTFPTAALSWRMRPAQKHLSATPVLEVEDKLPLHDLLVDLIQPLLRDRSLSIDLVSEAAQMSVRSLQRHLAEEGLSYSDLLAEARFDLATKLLGDPHAKIIDVSLELGYDDPAHFCRAFRSLSGQSPTEYRRSHAEEMH